MVQMNSYIVAILRSSMAISCRLCFFVVHIESDPDATKVQIRVEGGAPLARRFKKTDKVSALFAFVIDNVSVTAVLYP